MIIKLTPEIQNFQLEFNNYLNKKQILRNDSPVKYWFLNIYFFINVTFVVWILWQLWTVIAILFPANNTKIINGSNIFVVFRTAFNYVYKIFSTEGGETSYTYNNLSVFEDAYQYIGLFILFAILAIYTATLINNFLNDIVFIGISKSIDSLIKKCSLAKTWLPILVFSIISFQLWTIIALIYPPLVSTSDTGTSFSTFLYVSNSEIGVSTFFLPFTKLGLITFLINAAMLVGIIYVYKEFLYEVYGINNYLFFSEGRTYKPTKEKKESKKFNKKYNKNKFFNFYKVNFQKQNTEGYIAELTDVNKIYYVDNNPFYALKDINLKIKKGEFIIILGPSGSGKTTLLNLLSGVDKQTTGEVILNNCDIKLMNDQHLNWFRRKYIGYIFQHYALLWNLVAKENIEIVQHLKEDKSIRKTFVKMKNDIKESPNIKEKFNTLLSYIYAYFAGKENETEVYKLLNILNLEEQAYKFPHQLSGGQQQRVAIARALIKKPKILFGDEPTGALDSETTKKILELFKLINKYANTTIVMITHNHNIAKIADRIIYISNSRIVKDIRNKNTLKISDLKNI